jgi:hypothetical protein
MAQTQIAAARIPSDFVIPTRWAPTKPSIDVESELLILQHRLEIMIDLAEMVFANVEALNLARGVKIGHTLMVHQAMECSDQAKKLASLLP